MKGPGSIILGVIIGVAVIEGLDYYRAVKMGTTPNPWFEPDTESNAGHHVPESAPDLMPEFIVTAPADSDE